MSERRYCPLCHEAVAYVPWRGGRIWVHVETGSYLARLPIRHDVNTYAAELLPAQPD